MCGPVQGRPNVPQYVNVQSDISPLIWSHSELSQRVENEGEGGYRGGGQVVRNPSLSH